MLHYNQQKRCSQPPSASGSASAPSANKRGRLDSAAREVQHAMQAYTASPAQILKARKHISLFFFKNDVALQLIEDDALVAAFST